VQNTYATVMLVAAWCCSVHEVLPVSNGCLQTDATSALVTLCCSADTVSTARDRASAFSSILSSCFHRRMAVSDANCTRNLSPVMRSTCPSVQGCGVGGLRRLHSGVDHGTAAGAARRHQSCPRAPPAARAPAARPLRAGWLSKSVRAASLTPMDEVVRDGHWSVTCPLLVLCSKGRPASVTNLLGACCCNRRASNGCGCCCNR
jgi:hypothetical protein